MAKDRKPIDIGDIHSVPELLHIVEEIRDTKATRVITRNGEDLAVLSPVKAIRRASRPRTKADYEAFLASAGGWKDLVDTEQLKRDIAASRSISSRPPVRL